MQSVREFQIRPLHGYRDIFGQHPPKDHLDKLAKYPTDLLIMILAKVNAILLLQQGWSEQSDKEIFRLAFDKLDQRPFNDLFSRMGSKQYIFASQPIVNLMGQLIARFTPVTDPVPSEAELEHIYKELLLSILATNDSYYDHIDGKNQSTLDHIWKLELRQQHYARNMNNLFGAVPLKTFLFFRFMKERYGEEILKEFSDSFGIQSEYDFYNAFLSAIANLSVESGLDGQPKYLIVDETLKRILKPFVFDPTDPDKSSFSGESFALINQPFYRFDEGIAILDFTFFSHLTDIGLIHHFYHSTSLKKKHGIKNYNEYLGIVGKHFFEEYLMLQFIQKLFSHPHDKILGDKDDPKYPDILLLQNNKDVFVIEIKSARIHGKALDEADITSFQKFLEDNFASEKTKAGQKDKGIYQLKKQILYIKNKGDKFRIYPIIIYTEPSMDIAGVNNFLDDKFEMIIQSERSSSCKIYPLTCINLHFFIQFYPSLKEDRYFLRNSIIEYHRKRKAQFKKAAKDENSYLYFKAQFSFARTMEQRYPTEHPVDYFKYAVRDLGFKVK